MSTIIVIPVKASEEPYIKKIDPDVLYEDELWNELVGGVEKVDHHEVEHESIASETLLLQDVKCRVPNKCIQKLHPSFKDYCGPLVVYKENDEGELIDMCAKDIGQLSDVLEKDCLRRADQMFVSVSL